MNSPALLADRLGLARHVSPLLRSVDVLRQRFPSPSAADREDWLIDLANARGANVISRQAGSSFPNLPAPDVFSNEELIAAMLSPICRDRPEILRPAAQLVTRGVAEIDRLCHAVERERAGRVLAALAREALRAEPSHPVWQQLAQRFQTARPLRDVLLHWTRLAEPVMKNGRCNAERWKLVA